MEIIPRLCNPPVSGTVLIGSEETNEPWWHVESKRPVATVRGAIAAVGPRRFSTKRTTTLQPGRRNSATFPCPRRYGVHSRYRMPMPDAFQVGSGSISSRWTGCAAASACKQNGVIPAGGREFKARVIFSTFPSVSLGHAWHLRVHGMAVIGGLHCRLQLKCQQGWKEPCVVFQSHGRFRVGNLPSNSSEQGKAIPCSCLSRLADSTIFLALPRVQGHSLTATSSPQLSSVPDSFFHPSRLIRRILQRAGNLECFTIIRTWK
jgi:hypothetical protein